MTVRTSQAQWKGSLKQGQGKMKLGSGAFEGAYSFPSRFENGKGTNPEELIGAAHAGCFSMAFSLFLGNAGYTPTRIDTTARVHLEPVGGGVASRVADHPAIHHLSDTEDLPGDVPP